MRYTFLGETLLMHVHSRESASAREETIDYVIDYWMPRTPQLGTASTIRTMVATVAVFGEISVTEAEVIASLHRCGWIRAKDPWIKQMRWIKRAQTTQST
jgi:hypothetical protein